MDEQAQSNRWLEILAGASSHPRRRFRVRFRLRTIVVLLTVICIFFGWTRKHAEWKNERAAALNRLLRLRPYGTEIVPSQGFASRPWGQRLVGGHTYSRISWERVDEQDAELTSQLERLFPEALIQPLTPDEVLEQQARMLFPNYSFHLSPQPRAAARQSASLQHP